MATSILEARGGCIIPQADKRGYHIVYREHETNYCPGRGPLEEIAAAIGPAGDELAEGRAVGAQSLVGRPLAGWHVRGEPGAGDRDVLGGLLVEAERLGAARARGQKGDPVHDPADQGDVEVEMARRMADHGVELAAGPGIRGEVAADADIAVAMGEPGPAMFRIVGDR